jgi:hypothetical protein
MDQTLLDFTVPVAPSASRLAKHASWTGAVSASERVGRQALALLTLYRQVGPLTDRAAAEQLGLERSSICARRNELIRRGLVQAIDLVKTDRRTRNTRWGLRPTV